MRGDDWQVGFVDALPDLVTVRGLELVQTCRVSETARFYSLGVAPASSSHLEQELIIPRLAHWDAAHFQRLLKLRTESAWEMSTLAH